MCCETCVVPPEGTFAHVQAGKVRPVKKKDFLGSLGVRGRRTMKSVGSQRFA